MSIKIGDKFYIPAEVLSFSGVTKVPYKVALGLEDEDTQQPVAWFAEKDLTNPVPKLPIPVAQELENTKNYMSLYNYLSIVLEMSSESSFQKTITWLKASDDPKERDTRIQMLANAWLDVWDTEPELYNLVLGTRDDSPLQAAFVKITDWDDNTYLSLNAGSITHDLSIPQYQFTQEEIDKYNENLWIKNLDLNDYKVEVKD